MPSSPFQAVLFSALFFLIPGIAAADGHASSATAAQEEEQPSGASGFSPSPESQKSVPDGAAGEAAGGLSESGADADASERKAEKRISDFGDHSSDLAAESASGKSEDASAPSDDNGAKAAVSPSSPASKEDGAEDGTFRRGDFSFRPRLDIRVRGERRENMMLDQTLNPKSDLERFYLRTGIGADLKWRWLEAAADITDGREMVHDADSNTAEMDITQLYLGLNRPGGIPLQIRLGRQNWNIGSRRLISSSSWGNKKRSWDGIMAEADFGQARVQAFGGSVVDIENGKFDHGKFDEILWGALLNAKAAESVRVEVYLFGLYKDAYRDSSKPIRGENGGIGSENRMTPGFRVYGNISSPEIDWEFEGAFQVGSRAGDSIHAFAFASSVGWTLPIDTSPRIALEVTYASGDPNSEDFLEQTFVPLYGTTHSPYGIADLFRWQNMIEVSPSITLKLHPKFSLRLEHHTYWLAETGDEWVNSSGKVLRQGSGDESRYAGQEVSAVASWKFSRYLNFQAGASNFMSGTLMRDTGDKTGAFFGFIQTTIKI